MAKKLEAVSLQDITPSSIAVNNQIVAMNAALDPLLWATGGQARLVLLLSRIDELSSEMLDMLAWQYHVDIYEPDVMPIEQKRALVKNALLVHRYKGTRWALRQTLLDLGFADAIIYEWSEFGGKPYTFNLKVRPFDEERLVKAKRVALEYKNVRSQLEDIISQMSIKEEAEVADEAFIRRDKLLGDRYPWPENLYSDLETPLKYLGATDNIAAKYGIYETPERLTTALKVYAIDYMFAQYQYGDLAQPEHYYDGDIVYGADIELTDSVMLQAASDSEMAQETLLAEVSIGVTIQWIL